MSVRTILSTALAATALPFAAPVATHAVSYDCIVMQSYEENIRDLMSQKASVFQVAKDQEDSNDWGHAWGSLRTMISVSRAIGHQLDIVAAKLASPIYQATARTWANEEKEYANIWEQVVNAKGQVPDSLYTRMGALDDAEGGYMDDYFTAEDTSCSA